MDRVTEERIALLGDMATAYPGMRALLAELLLVLETIERTVVASKIKNPDGLPFDINEYTASSNSKLRADTTLKLGDHRHIGDITFFREELAGVTTKEQDLVNYNYNWLFREPWFFSALFSYERDPIIELDSRVTVSADIGRDIWDTPRRTLNLQLGAGFRSEEIGLKSVTSSVATRVLRFRHDFFGDDLELFHNHSITTNISGRTNTSYKTSTGLRYEITDFLYANISFDYDYETEPVDTAKKEDITLLFGLGLEF